MNSVKKFLARHHTNFRGWHTNRKIVVIESDDWGSICMPSPEVYRTLIRKGIRVDKCPYATNDSLASEEDLKQLFSTLSDFRDYNGKSPVITANAVMANPDFDKIRESGYEEYHYELFTDSLKHYPAHGHSFEIWKQGISEKLFYPQFHGREHVNVKTWLEALRNPNSFYNSVFDLKVNWLGPKYHNGRVRLRATYDTDHLSDLYMQSGNIQEGLHLFKKIFGYSSKSFIAPNFVFHPDLCQVLYDNNVRYIQGMKYQKLPIADHLKRKMIRHHQGKKDKIGLYYLVRNCVFEPSQQNGNQDIVGNCLRDIQNAFNWRKPAIITAHRLNFIGFINPANRQTNLKLFRELLREILRKWPDVEFMSSVELGDIISYGDNKE